MIYSEEPKKIEPILISDHPQSAQSLNQYNQRLIRGKKRGKPNIAPLQPPTLATFRSWGSSAGAGRADLPGRKNRKRFEFDNGFLIFLR
jgi:hypothetical protein